MTLSRVVVGVTGDDGLVRTYVGEVSSIDQCEVHLRRHGREFSVRRERIVEWCPVDLNEENVLRRQLGM